MNAEQYLRGRYGAYRGHHEWRALEEAFNAGVMASKLHNPVVQSIQQFAMRPYYHCDDLAYNVICTHQHHFGEWEDSFWGTKAERMQGRVFCLIVAEALS